MDRDKKLRRNAIIALSVGIPIYAFIITVVMLNHTWHANFLVDLLCLSLIPVAVIVILLITIICVDGARYKSIEDEVQDEKNENPETAHEVLEILTENEKEAFVLAYFFLDDMIRPAVYNKYGKRYTSIDLHTSLISYKKIYPVPNVNSKDSNVRIMRIRNKHSKNQMIFFATKLADANLSFNGIKPREYECEGLGSFSIFGCEYAENSKPEVTINGKAFPLKETLVDFMFISKHETGASGANTLD
ncbi:MAG TPA: hypothetical protein DEO32_02420 [Ruminococcaceae bacterium]|nr:hypothetical protein [Oscillospiraceae bacterium]